MENAGMRETYGKHEGGAAIPVSNQNALFTKAKFSSSSNPENWHRSYLSLAIGRTKIALL
jgi:hypothetical protein